MSAKKLKVVVTRKLPAPVELRLKELFDAKLNDDDHPFTQEELVEAMQSADVLVPTVTDRLDGRVMARAGEQLRLPLLPNEQMPWHVPLAPQQPGLVQMPGDAS